MSWAWGVVLDDQDEVGRASTLEPPPRHVSEMDRALLLALALALVLVLVTLAIALPLPLPLPLPSVLDSPCNSV